MKVTWRVRLHWIVNGSSWEAACDAGGLDHMTAMGAIIEVARWRGVDLSKCTAIEVERIEQP